MTELPDLWDDDAVVEWLSKEIEAELLRLLVTQAPYPLRYDATGRRLVLGTIAGVLDPYHSGLT